MRLIFCALVLSSQLAFAISPESIPAPTANNWVIDLTGRIPAVDLRAANDSAEAINKRKLGQLAVLIIGSTNGQDPRRFAEAVHYHWKIGTGRGDGVLYFVALDDRAAEILLPYGLRSSEDQYRSDQAMQQVIVPAFKRGALGEAIREGTSALVRLLEASPLNNGGPTPAPVEDVPPARAVRSAVQLPNPPARGFSVDAANALSASAKSELEAALNGIYADGHGKLYVYTVRASDFDVPVSQVAATLLDRLHPQKTPGVQVAVLATDARDAAIVGESLMPSANGWAIQNLLDETEAEMVETRNPDESLIRFVQRYDTLVTYGPRVSNYTSHALAQTRQFIDRNTAGVVVATLAVLGAAAFGLMKFLRFRKRRCKVCGDHRQRLDEQSDDSYLSAGQKHEEALSSVDYDVWWCTRCEDALVLRYRAWWTRYKTCPKCDFVCAMQSTRTLIHATYSSGGQVEVNLKCDRCGHHQSHVRYTPRLQRSTTSSSSSSFSSGSRSSGSSFGGSSGRW